MKKLLFVPAAVFFPLALFTVTLFSGTARAECVKTVEEGEWENPGKQEVLRVIIERPCKKAKKAEGEEELKEPAFSRGPDWIVTVYGKAFWTFPPRSWGRRGAVSAGFGEGAGIQPDGRLQATGGDRYIFTAYRSGAMRKYVFIKIAEDKEDTIEVKLSLQEEDEGYIGKPESFFLKRKK